MAYETQLKQITEYADVVSAGVVNKLKFKNLAKVSTDLQGKASESLTRTTYDYIGDANEVLEGEDIGTTELSQSQELVTLKKVGKGVTVSFEDIESRLGDTEAEIVSQLEKAILRKVDNDTFAALSTATKSLTVTALDDEAIRNAVALLDEQFEDDVKVLFVNQTQYNAIYKNLITKSTDNTEAIVKGVVGEYMGCQLVVSNKITNVNYIVAGSETLGIELKRDMKIIPTVHGNKEKIDFHTSSIYGAYIRNKGGVVKIIVDAGGEIDGENVAG